ncbi:MAG: recombination mediator RecR [Pseudomonadota bacterium]|nr:recombination protein RecR [Gammaproteobacteria bacterium]MEC8465826.1 recombination mediator RecR [Pseudomonadota bacterium]URQ70375.1 recombination mediator RecR [SAR86 cluster bacterium]GIS26500.1 MAG: recombination protein RecR [Gammaproteobacteria bacterium]|tara:strand:- start:522 stop:1109 length:588 start_codon:yes stop_codon:yes gene_type:complete
MKDLLHELIEALTLLPGVGKKSAQRMALFLLDKNKDGAMFIAETLKTAVENVRKCNDCRILTSSEICSICSDGRRDKSKICVVENPSDVLAIETTGGFRGLYFVLMGRLSPLDDVKPEDLGIPQLITRINKGVVKEIILATSSTVEGDATAYFIKDHIKNAKVSRISYGIPIGGELEYVDANTIARAIQGRIDLS